MKYISALCGFFAAAGILSAQQALTIYNQNFAVVRDSVRLDLRQGLNELRYPGVTVQLEPDSIVLRDLTGKRHFQIVEQSFRNDPLTQDYLLSLFEGKTIEFESTAHENGQPRKEIIRGRIVRSGYVPQFPRPIPGPRQNLPADVSQPVIEVDGKLRFSLPGIPLFPSLGDDTILKPMLLWTIQTDKPGRLDAELSYITGGMSWEADYNAVAPENGDTVDLTGWITVNNQSGKTFEKARIKLLAGDVSKVQPDQVYYAEFAASRAMKAPAPAVTEKSFDEYHLYTLGRPTTLLDRETKQVEFIRATGIPAQSVYIYDGAQIDTRYRDYESIRYNREYGTQSNKKVWVMREFYNSETNHLGMALPKGRLRFYRRDSDGQMEFTGEDTIDHTPKNELIRVSTGNAFDLVGERKRTNFKQDPHNHWVDETFEIKLRNRKKVPVEIRVVEHLYRWTNWEITQKSDDFEKTDAQTIEFRVSVPPDEERRVSYTVHYAW